MKTHTIQGYEHGQAGYRNASSHSGQEGKCIDVQFPDNGVKFFIASKDQKKKDKKDCYQRFSLAPKTRPEINYVAAVARLSLFYPSEPIYLRYQHFLE